VLVNQYERDRVARDACLKRHGFRCAVCEMSFEERYGDIGKDFIHVHHKKPLAACREAYRIDPARDLVPVCPNCHAMLHTSDPPWTVEELRWKLVSRH
jgi:5-methylcytosine-specific restriction protein A